MADSKKYDGSQWQHSLRKLTTATEAVENPLYSDGTAITNYTISGNTVQNGTGTPDSPVMPNGTGERTGNLFDKSSDVVGYYIAGNIGLWTQTGSTSRSVLVKCEPNTTYTIYVKTNRTLRAAYFNNFPSVGDAGYGVTDYTTENYINKTLTITTGSSAQYLAFFCYNSAQEAARYDEAEYFSQIMLNTGSHPHPYEPYGYKIPISSGGVTTNICLGSTQTVRAIKKVVLTGDETECAYAQGTFYITDITDYAKINNAVTCLCTHYVANKNITSISAAQFGVCFYTGSDASAYRLYLKDSTITSKSDWQTYLAAQYSAGTPVTVWYVLATPETASVNEPLMKIGDYADTLSNTTAIPTTEGSNSITVDTTVQPSEFTATWTGWHDSSVKEWDGSDWQ